MTHAIPMQWFLNRYGASAGFWAYLAYNERRTDRLLSAWTRRATR